MAVQADRITGLVALPFFLLLLLFFLLSRSKVLIRETKRYTYFLTHPSKVENEGSIKDTPQCAPK